MLSSAAAAGTQQIYSQGSPFPPGHSGKAFRYAPRGLGAVAAPLVWGQQDEAGPPGSGCRAVLTAGQPAPSHRVLPTPTPAARSSVWTEAAGRVQRPEVRKGPLGTGAERGETWPTVSRAWEQRSRGHLGTQRDLLRNALNEAWEAAGRERLRVWAKPEEAAEASNAVLGARGEEGLGETGPGEGPGGAAWRGRRWRLIGHVVPLQMLSRGEAVVMETGVGGW